ncbi:uncharacterized protein Eint_070490 [Encephalitozoon intestinalis ATCC 50506]|uniref:Uncharacterized protein n=1 Tax=Encephalitozoon intestinalis (strain ATCC 50506) TaxID=876142 RepID=E0S7X8_ENCIT|nr:uncharacterized protein Eint_070490 [Encephalitozoon intestinalis ATCC 50506]ADM11813.1 hypothetical protein Eint_070490 [Encephalitozoon intestinalis ATCC 50506]UTX45563.1 hypothetical protein GPK93_07g11260 [Encephalitozoon intestinalis]
MRKINKAVHSDPNIEELLLSLQIENESLEEGEAFESSSSLMDEPECRLAGDIVHRDLRATDADMKALIEGGKCKISGNSLPFSLFEVIKKKESTETAVVSNQKFLIEGGRYDYGFTPKDLERYRIKRKRRIKETCPNWEDISEEKRNEPRKVHVRSLKLRNKR